MGLIDFILNIAALLLWLNWRAFYFNVVKAIPAVSILATLQKPEPDRKRSRLFLLALLSLLMIRSLFYWQIGSKTGWTPQLDLGAIALSFRSTFYSQMLLYSVVHFFYLLAIVYSWMLFLSLLEPKGGMEKGGSFQIFRLHLPTIERLPRWLKFLLPGLTVTFLWLGSYWLWRLPGAVPAQILWENLVKKSPVIGAGIYLSWKYLLVAIFALYFVNHYVYLGNHSAWKHLTEVGNKLLAPIRVIPCQIWKFDLSPPIAIALTLLAAEFASKGLTRLYQMIG